MNVNFCWSIYVTILLVSGNFALIIAWLLIYYCLIPTCVVYIYLINWFSIYIHFFQFQQNGPIGAAGFANFNVSAGGHPISTANYNNNNPAFSTALSTMSSPPPAATANAVSTLKSEVKFSLTYTTCRAKKKSWSLWLPDFQCCNFIQRPNQKKQNTCAIRHNSSLPFKKF